MEQDARAGPPDHQHLASPNQAFADGQIVSGRYRIVRLIGRGGMGEVYEAEDLDLREHVALKTLLPEIAGDSRMIARFKQEIHLSRRVSHPNVCNVFDLARHPADGSAPDATVYLSMEFLPGETLSAKIARDRPLPLEAALPLLDQMAAALDAAHAAGVIHRDFKPSNVMLVPASGGVRAVVTDFGLARSVHYGETTVTATSQLMGTFDYMAPELFAGRPATTASDIYALGMTCCKMLTGALPSLAARGGAVSVQKATEGLDAACKAAIARVLDPDPAKRFTSAEDFVRALRGEKSQAMTFALPAMTRRRVFAAVAALALAVALAAALAIWRGDRNRPSPEAAARYRQGVDDIHIGAYFAATRPLAQAVRAAPHFAPAHARLAEAWLELQVPETARTEMALIRPEDQSGLSETERLLLDAIYLTINRDFTGAVSKYEQMRRRAPADLDIDLGRAYEKASRGKDARECYRRAAEGPEHNPAAWLRLAVLSSREGDAAKSAEAFRQAEEGYRNNVEGTIEIAYQRGVAANRRSQYAEGAIQLLKARETARLAGNLQQDLNATLELAVAANATGDAAAAERYATEAVETAQANQMGTFAIRGLAALGANCAQKGDFPAAERHYLDGLNLARGNNAFRLIALCQLSLSSLYSRMGRSDDAVREARDALAYYQPNGFAYESWQALTLIGRYQRNRGDLTAALGSFQSAAEAAKKSGNPAAIAGAEESLGSLLAVQERYPEALDHYRRKLDLAPNDQDKGYAGLEYGETLWVLGRYEEAGRAFADATARAAKFPDLQLKLARSRADMALSQGRATEAADMARRSLAAVAAADVLSAAELKRILGLALLAAGKKSEGRRQCEESLNAVAKLGDEDALLDARLAVEQARVETGDRAGAIAIFHALEPALAGHPESRWRALATAGRVDASYLPSAREAYESLARLWGDAVWRGYAGRPDVQRLSRPLSQANTANHQ
jgi:tetratricopeptide (TPR) repeat protein